MDLGAMVVVVAAAESFPSVTTRVVGLLFVLMAALMFLLSWHGFD